MKAWVKVPASSGNLGSGFDASGAALSLFLELEITLTNRAQGDSIAHEDMIGRTVLPILKKKFPKHGFRFRCTSDIPMSKGLGSSAAARLAAVACAKLLSGEKKPSLETLSQAVKLEGHPDNAAASFFGGFCLSWMQKEEAHAHSFKIPKQLQAVVCIPDFDLATEKARAILPKTVSRQDAVFNLSRLGALVSAFSGKDFSLLKEGMRDRLHQPYRAKLIPGLESVMEAAVKRGAYGACLSGAGPSVLAIANGKKDLEAIGRAMEAAFSKKKIYSAALILSFDNRGITYGK